MQGKLTFVKNIQDEAKTSITLINTKIARFRELRCFPGTGTLVACSSTVSKLCFHEVDGGPAAAPPGGQHGQTE